MKRIAIAAIAPLLVTACAAPSPQGGTTRLDGLFQPANPALGIRAQSPAGFPAYETRFPATPGLWQGTDSAPAPTHEGH
ncbi:hypothetical protein DEA8626_01781 [Defluviimonas aquaemixtae]|uniref:Uncharacterized protein n=1 Tax=Albidovulum aquaemixtae TaxID=1542388 RepID=A0A2R8B6K9_9RHOB|nr:hypothetical protein [Defluviimonas aquaemixtae]SPH18249.1 hypothetical protein DEA8626_01781 [Defluviimonas aquaemixtae]